MQIIQKIFEILMKNQRFLTSCPDCRLKKCRIHQHLLTRIEALVNENLPIQMILPGFPAKSSNRSKTLSNMPDYGEYIALKNLNDLCEEIRFIYPAGAKIVICSDGRVFNDLVMVAESDVLHYYEEIQKIIRQHKFIHLTLSDMGDFYSLSSVKEMHEKLISEHADSLDVIKEKITTQENHKLLFNGIHRFLFEDLNQIHNHLSRNKLRLLAKNLAYSVIQRSNAWSSLIEKHFNKAIRLSIHPQSCESHKLGIKLISTNDGWATPWHNVLVKKEDKFILQKNKVAIQNSSELKFQEGLAYYEA